MDRDGTMIDENTSKYNQRHFDEYLKNTFLLEDKFKILKKITDMYGLSVVVSASCKIGSENPETWEENLGLMDIINTLKKFDIPFAGVTPSVPNPGMPWGQQMWKDFDIQAYLFLNKNVTHYVIVDDATENDLDSLKDHLIKTEYNEDGFGNGGLLPHHVEEIKDKLKPREVYTEDEMKENPLYKQIMDSEYNLINSHTDGLFIKNEEYFINILVTFDKKSVLYHSHDIYDGDKWGVFNTYEDFLELLRYFNIIERNDDEKKLMRRC